MHVRVGAEQHGARHRHRAVGQRAEHPVLAAHVVRGGQHVPERRPAQHPAVAQLVGEVRPAAGDQARGQRHRPRAVPAPPSPGTRTAGRDPAPEDSGARRRGSLGVALELGAGRSSGARPCHAGQPAVPVAGPAPLVLGHLAGAAGSGTALGQRLDHRVGHLGRLQHAAGDASASPGWPRPSSIGVRTPCGHRQENVTPVPRVPDRQPLGQRHRAVLGDRVRRAGRPR